MAPKPPLLGLTKVTFTQTYSGRSFGDSLYFMKSVPSTWSSGELFSLASEAANAYVANMLPLQNPGLVLARADATDLSDTGGREATMVSGVGGGSTGTHPLPLNSVAHIALEVLRRYRGGRPGYNISGLDASMMTDERTFSTASTIALSLALQAMITQILTAAGISSPIANVGVSYFLDKVLRPVPVTEAISDYETQQRLCTLRKRMGKGITS